MQNSVIEATVEVAGVRFRNDTGDFAVIDCIDEASGDHFVAVGDLGHLEPGDRAVLQGSFQEHHQHGKRFRPTSVRTLPPDSNEAILRLLCRVPGIGPVSAEALVDQFKDSLLETLETKPGTVFKNVRGLKGKKLIAAVAYWESDASTRALRLLLEKHNVDAATIGRIIRSAEDGLSLKQLKDNPYSLTERTGIGFRSADTVALALGEPFDSDNRIAAAALFALKQASDDGHCYLPLPELLKRTSSIVTPVDEFGYQASEFPSVEPVVNQMIQNDQLTQVDQLVGDPQLVEMETELASLIQLLSSSKPSLKITVTDQPPAELDPAPTAEQWQAVKQACHNRLSVLTGGPGTGKTQTMRALVEQVRQAGKKVVLCAPTGKASRRLSSATGAEAMTIHRLLGYTPDEGFIHDEDSPLEGNSMIVVDEASMLSLELALSLFRAIGQGSHLLLVGDINQLAPVGPGRVLQDILESETVHFVNLTEIFRQANRSLIVRAAHSINRGQQPEISPQDDDVRDFFLIERPDARQIQDEVASLVCERLPKHFNVSPVGEIQVLVPQRRGICGVEQLNERLRANLNPLPNEDNGKVPTLGWQRFREGDRVMQTRNDYELEVMNGELGVLLQIDRDGKSALVRMDDSRTIRVPSGSFDSWELAYACTVHKSQGSSIPVAVIAIAPEHRRMLSRNLLYTAVTRAESACVLIADRKSISSALSNLDGATRYTNLKPRLLHVE